MRNVTSGRVIPILLRKLSEPTTLREIYNTVEAEVQLTVEDSSLCGSSCNSTDEKWQHVIRSTIQRQKTKGVIVQIRDAVYVRSDAR